MTEPALALLADAGFDPVYGARPLKRAIKQKLEKSLAKQILSGDIPIKSLITVIAHDGQLDFDVTSTGTDEP